MSKREGDGATPIGRFAMRQVLYRADRGPRPRTTLPSRAIRTFDGWCEDPNDPNYNRLIKLSPRYQGDRLTREDHLYDLIVVLGYNDDPVVPGLGSAIFLHVARPDFSPTEGCVALARSELERFLMQARPGDSVIVEE